MSDLEPITRAENFWVNEGDLEPITRKEQYIKHLYDETQVVPEYPKTREEYFINKAGEELHDVTIEQLTATENRTYSEEGVAYSPVIVNVPQTTLTTLDVTENGTYTAPSGTAYDEVDVDVPLPENAYLLKEASGSLVSFDDGADLPMPSFVCNISAVQDLHGYDAPWVGGAGKNKLLLSFTDGSQTNGITIHKNNDGTIKITGKATAQAVITIGEYATPIAQSIKYSGAVGGSASTYSVNIAVNGGYNYSDVYDGDSNAVNVSANDVIREVVVVRSGYECPTSGIIFYPMIRLATETDPTFAPYSNICPISGWDEVNVTVADDTTDPTTENVYTIDLDGTRYGGKVDVVNGIVTPAPYYASYNGEALTGEWISDRDKYEVGATPTIGAQVVNIGASDTPVSLTPTIIKSLQGDNNLFASTGEIEMLQYWGEVS